MTKNMCIRVTVACFCIACNALFASGRKRSNLLDYGLVDVTSAPFHADPSGRQDSTQALQKAIDYAQAHHKVAFFPIGTYRISDTLECRQVSPPSSVDRGRFKSGRYWGITLLGSRSGPNRPRIILAPEPRGMTTRCSPRSWSIFIGEPPKTNPCLIRLLAPGL